VDSGTILRMSKKGNISVSGIAGDLLLKVNVKPDPYFKREGYDIYTDKYITFTQAVLGSTIKVRTLQGCKDLKVAPGSAPDQTIKLEGKGVQKLPPN